MLKRKEEDFGKSVGNCVMTSRQRILALAKTIDDFYEVRNKNNAWTPVYKVRFLALALAGEVGEFCNLVKKNWRGDKATLPTAEESRRYSGSVDGDTNFEFQQKIHKELADVYIYLLMIADAMGVDLDIIAINKLESWSPK